jgi:hypothetical protein
MRPASGSVRKRVAASSRNRESLPRWLSLRERLKPRRVTSSRAARHSRLLRAASAASSAGFAAAALFLPALLLASLALRAALCVSILLQAALLLAALLLAALLLPYVLLRIAIKFLLAVIPAECVLLALIVALRQALIFVHLHTTHWIFGHTAHLSWIVFRLVQEPLDRECSLVSSVTGLSLPSRV